jgi:hypothetical protein
MQVPFSFCTRCTVQMSKVARQAQQRAVAGASALMGDLTATPCATHEPIRDANASSEWDSAKGPQLLRPLAGQALQVIRYIDHGEQTRANRLRGSILARQGHSTNERRDAPCAPAPKTAGPDSAR